MTNSKTRSAGIKQCGFAEANSLNRFIPLFEFAIVPVNPYSQNNLKGFLLNEFMKLWSFYGFLVFSQQKKEGKIHQIIKKI